MGSEIIISFTNPIQFNRVWIITVLRIFRGKKKKKKGEIRQKVILFNT